VTRVVGIITRKLLGVGIVIEDGNPTPAQYRPSNVLPLEGDGAPAAPVGDDSPTDSDAETPTLFP